MGEKIKGIPLLTIILACIVAVQLVTIAVFAGLSGYYRSMYSEALDDKLEKSEEISELQEEVAVLERQNNDLLWENNTMREEINSTAQN